MKAAFPEESPEEESDRELSWELAAKLEAFGIHGEVTKITHGPIITLYEYQPSPGGKMSQIEGLSNDLALALSAQSVRIVAPIPGQPLVGIEVAHNSRHTFHAKDIIEHETFQHSTSKLTLALGRDIEGTPYLADLNKMPHLLIAGATGTGKSVAIRAMVASMVSRAMPEEVRFIMVDPKESQTRDVPKIFYETYDLAFGKKLPIHRRRPETPIIPKDAPVPCSGAFLPTPTKRARFCSGTRRSGLVLNLMR